MNFVGRVRKANSYLSSKMKNLFEDGEWKGEWKSKWNTPKNAGGCHEFSIIVSSSLPTLHLELIG
jgi:hypothetical protein